MISECKSKVAIHWLIFSEAPSSGGKPTDAFPRKRAPAVIAFTVGTESNVLHYISISIVYIMCHIVHKNCDNWISLDEHVKIFAFCRYVWVAVIHLFPCSNLTSLNYGQQKLHHQFVLIRHWAQRHLCCQVKQLTEQPKSYGLYNHTACIKPIIIVITVGTQDGKRSYAWCSVWAAASTHQSGYL